MKKDRIIFGGIALSLVALLCALCFLCLGRAAVNGTDEARHGVNAYEMLRDGEWLVSTFMDDPDYYNLKPPLSDWAIMLGYRLFGYNRVGLRAFSAVSLLASCLLCAFYAAKRHGAVAGVTVLLLCCACCPFYAQHYGRAGDADALFGLLFTGAMLAMLELERHPRFLYLCGLCFSLAFLAKSWHAGMIAIIGGLFLLGSGLIRRYRPAQWLGFAAASAGPILLWALARFRADGMAFLEQMVQVDLLARTATELEGHHSGVLYYFDYVFCSRWILPILLLTLPALGIWFARRKNSGWHTGEFLGLVLWSGVNIALFSIPRTRLYWYIIPALFGLILLAGICAQMVWDTVREAGLRAVMTAAVGLLAVLSLSVNVRLVVSEPVSAFQEMLEASFSREADYAGAILYLYDSDGKTSWAQENLLVAQWAGDFHPRNGGIESFLEADHACLLAADAVYKALADSTFAGMKVTPLEGYYLVQK